MQYHGSVSAETKGFAADTIEYGVELGQKQP